jgi:hypothetical protein
MSLDIGKEAEKFLTAYMEEKQKVKSAGFLTLPQDLYYYYK